MTQNKEICCCPANSWAKVIAWIQIIFYSLSTILWTYVLIVFAIVASNHKDETKITDEEPEHFTSVVIGILFAMILLVAVCIAGIVMGVVLFKGAKHANTSYLTSWIIFAVISYIVAIFTSIYGQDRVTGITNIVFITILHSFGLWVVHVLKREIQNGVGIYANRQTHGFKA